VSDDSFKRDFFEPDVVFELEEASGDVDGKHVIAKLKGTFFVPNGVSRNNRFYPKDLWEDVIKSSEVQDKLKNRRMLGTVGHDLPIDDKAVRDGMISHMVTNLSISEAGDGKLKGIGEALVLDTPAGRSLNTLLRAGSKMFTSSRAFGKFNGTENGVPKVDKSSYKFDTFDFVLDPGFAEANPKLVEQLEINSSKNKENDMAADTELLEKVVKQNANLQTDLTKAISESEDYKTKFENLGKELAATRATLADKEANVKALGEKVATHEATIAAYKEVGSPKDCKDALTSLKEQLEKYTAVGSVEKINEALTKAGDLLNQYKVLGTPKELDKAIDESVKTIQEYKALGTPAKINEALDKAITLIEKYKEFGSIEELGKVFEKMGKMASEKKNEGFAKRCKDLASELRVSEDTVKKLVEKGFKDEEIREVLKKVSESVKVRTTYQKPADDKNAKPINETEERTNPLEESRVSRIMHGFGNK
jgi:hypothetical protein